MNDNINKIQKILQNKVGYQGSSADLMKYLETPENKEKLVKILNNKVGYKGTVDDFNSYIGIQVPKVEGVQTVSAPSVTVGAPEVNVMSPLSSNVPTATPKVDWATQEEGSITKPIGGELEREQPVNFEGMTPDPKNNPDYSVTNQSGKFVYTFDKEKSERRKEKDAFNTILDEQEKRINQMTDSVGANIRRNANNVPTNQFIPAYSGAAIATPQTEDGKAQGELLAAQTILKDAKQAWKAPKKGENWAKSFGIGGAETVTDPDAWLFGVLSLNEVGQSLPIFEKVEKGEPLTDTESAVMDAMLTRTQAEAMRSGDTSNWYKGGKIAGESLPFMRDMALTGGLNTITTAAGKGAVKLAQRATAKYLRKKAEKQLLKEGIDITEDILSRRAADLFMRTANVADYSGRVLAASTVTPAVRTPLMATSYSGIAKNMQPKVVGDEFGTYQIQEGDDFGTAVGKQFVEVQSEGVGEFFAPILKGVKFLGGKAIPKVISDSKFGQVGSKVVDAIMLDNPYLQKAGVSGIAGEVGEEIFGQTEQYLSGLTTKEDLDNFYSGDNFKSMLIGFAPMSALGMAGNTINYGANEVQYRRAKKELGGITDELDNSSVGELGNKISDVLIQNNAFDEAGNLTEDGRRLNNNLVSYAQRKMAKDIANDGKQENPNSRYYDFLLNDRSKKWLESYLADNDLTAPMYFNLAYKATLHENELTDYERKTLSELDRAFNGYLKAEDAAQQASAEIDAQVNPTNNKIQNVMVGGQPHMVKGGNIVMTENEEGKVILDKENSDQVITVVNAEGIPSQIGIEQLESVVGEVDAEDAKNAAIESAHTTAYNETFYPVGSIVYRKDAQGQFSAIKETGADGFTINSVTEGGEAVPTLIENTNSENFGVISLKAGDKYTLNDGTQLDIISNDGGVISASVNGQPSEQTTADELATLFESTGIDLAQFEPVVEDVVETPETEVQVPGVQVEETQATEQPEATYPTDKKGEPIFEQMPVEQSIKVVREFLGDDAVNFIEDKLKAANKAVKSVSKKAPKSTSLLGRKAEVESIALEKQKAAESLDYWTNVKRLMSEEAILATREQTPINQVVENPNQVGQVIIDRYESAKKVIGNSATITAPNGEVLKGRYVLVSAYAVTPSHNPFDGYNTSEGFPLNADGSNTNDRDYKNDKANQVVTEGIGSSFDGRALEKVPKVSKKGAVLDGNGTTMGSQLAAANGTDKAYLEALNNNAANYGFTASDLKSVSNPRIVFELETELPYTTEAFAMFNSEEKKSESATASAVAKSKQLSPSAVAKIAALVDSYSSLESFFSSETATAEMVKTLVDAKVINTLEIAKLIDNGLFSATGRELITNVLLGATLNEQAIRQIGNDSSLKGIIVRAMKQILENAKLKEYSLFEDINNAIGLMYEARKAKMAVSEFLLQTNMFEKGASERFSDFEQMLALAMSDSGVLFKGTMDKYNTVAAPLVGGQVDMFTGRILEPNEVKQQIIEYYGKTKSIINPNAGVDGRNRISETARTGRISTEQIQLETDLNPTEAQKKSGNYKKAHITVSGMDISVENPVGSVRRGTDEDGKAWEHEMKSHYGYFLKTEGKDGDHIDAFIKEGIPTDWNGTVFAIDQINPKTGAFDETKVMIGYETPEEAKAAYMENYDADWKGFSAITPVSLEDFKQWLYDGKKQRKPFNEYKETPEAIDNEQLPDIGKMIKKPAGSGRISLESAQVKLEEEPQVEQPQSVEEKEIVDTDSKIQNIVEQPKITATDEKIEDVGQKIGGAKKDLFQEYTKKLLSVTDQDIARLPLSKSFPRPNFAQLIEDGKMTQETAIFLNYFYDNIPTKPQKAYKVERWVKTVREALDTFNSVLERKPTRDLMQEFIDMLNTNILGQREAFKAEVYRAVRKAINFPNNDVNVGNLTIIRSKTVEDTYVYSVGSPVGNRVRLTGRFNTMEEAAEKLIEMAKETAGKPKQIEFSVYSSRSRGDFYITPKGKGEIVLQNGFKTSKEAFEYINENREALTDRFNAMKEIPSERRISNRERVGFDYRQGKNVTAEDFGKEFGFRGVEFGNWVNQEERQSHINEAYDALMDLASVIGVTPRALSLNGELGFAFGSRGGGKYAAHYETNKVVINLTKTKGAGTLAHEWFHALDNYLLRAVGNRTSYATEGSGFNKEGKPALRPELNDAFRNLMKVIRKSGFYTRSAKLDKVKGSRYWGTSIELGARGFEDFVMNKLAKSNIQNDYLVNFKSLAEFIDRVNGDISEITSKYPYPTMEESEAINEAYQNLFDTLQEDDNAVLFQSKSPIGFYNTVEKALETIQQDSGTRDQFRAMLLKNGRISLESAQAKFDAAITTEEMYKAALEITLILDEQNNTTTIVAKDNEEFISMLPAKYAEAIRKERVMGVFFKGQVIINSEKFDTGEELLLTYEHEWVHNANKNVHSSDELAELWDNSTDKKILPRIYLGSDDNIKGDELIAHIIEDIIQKQGYENYKNGNIDLSLYSQQEQLKKTIDYANKEYLRNVRGGDSRGNLHEDSNARKADENLQQANEGRQTPKFRQKDDGTSGQVERNVQENVSQRGGRVRKTVTTETLLIDGVERPTRNSNGAYIHSTEEGVRNFYAWFGDSKVVDAEGRPLVVYHGSGANKKFNIFNPDRTNWFTPTKNYAKAFGDKLMFEVYVKAENPLYVGNIDGIANDNAMQRLSDYSGVGVDKLNGILKEENGVNIFNITNSNSFKDLMIEKGYDSLEANEANGLKTFGVFSPSQIKSATVNNGEFDGNNPDIRFRIDTTITINGTPRPTTNSKGQPIAQTEQGIRNFWVWFGDSKVVDADGRPLVVNHGSRDEFTIFDKQFSGKSNSLASVGFWFSDVKDFGERFANNLWGGSSDVPVIYNTYLKLENPYIYESSDYSKELDSIDKEIYELKREKQKLENSIYIWDYNAIEAMNIAKTTGFKDKETEDYYRNRSDESSKAIDNGFKLRELTDKINKLQSEYHDKLFTDSYQKFRTDVYKIAGMSSRDANIGGLGMAIRNEDKVVGEYVSGLKEKGYDGIIIKNTSFDKNAAGGIENNQYVVFDNTQIKSATDNTGEFSESSEDIRFSIKSPIGFYSTVENALDKIQQEKGTKEQFKKMLLNNGAKQAEMDWMGFDELPEKLTKSDIQNWIDENRIEVEEVEKGDYSNRNLESIEVEPFVYNVVDTKTGEVILSNVSQSRADEFIDNAHDGTNTKFSQYVLPGGENYKELLLTMPKKTNLFNPDKVEIKRRYLSATQGNVDIMYNGEYMYRGLDMFKNYKERTDQELIAIAKDTYENGDRYNKIENKQGNFKSSHFEEPNILAHIRFDEREVNGERVLFIEEFQSDWAQKGKKEGFKDKNLDKKSAEVKSKMDALRNEIERARDKDAIDNNNGVRRGNNLRDWVDEYQPEKSAEFNELLKQLNAIEEVNEGGVPDMPFKQTPQWVNLSIRRMMRYASENGFDRIAWTNGKQQVDRYDLSKQVNEIEYAKSGNKYDLKVRDKNDNPIVKGLYSENELEDIVGKEIAKKIVEGEGKETVDKTKSLTGIDLKVGGEGMKAFYDAIVPSAMNKLGKPFGAKVEPIELQYTNTANESQNKVLRFRDWVWKNKTEEFTYNDAQKGITNNSELYKEYLSNLDLVQSLPVTESMKESVMEGVPLFSIKAPKFEKGASLKEMVATSNMFIAARADKYGAKGRRMVESEIKTVGKAINEQSANLKESANLVTDMVKALLNNGSMNNMTRAELSQILTNVRNASNKKDLTKEFDKISSIVRQIQLRNAKRRFNDLMKFKVQDKNAKGISIASTVDDETVSIITTIRKSLKELTLEDVENQINEINNLDKKTTSDETRLVGLGIARDYMNEIKTREAQLSQLAEELSKAKEELIGKKGEDRTSDKELVESIENMVGQVKAEMTSAYDDLSSRLNKIISEGKEALKNIKLKDKERVATISHFVNSDMKGIEPKNNPEKGRTFKQWLKSNLIISPLQSFDFMLRSLAPNQVAGNGYLHDHFSRGILKASQNAYEGTESAFKMIDEAVAKIFGDKFTFRYVSARDFKKMSKYEFTYGTEKSSTTITATNGQLAYIYAVNKMTDGAMKLRAMGISEEQVEEMKAALPVRIVKLVDAIQDEILPKLRVKYNNTHLEIFNTSMDAIENYFPLKIDKTSLHKKMDLEEESTYLSGLIKNSTNSIIKRKVNTRPIDIRNSDFADVLTEHIKDMEEWSAYAKIRRDLNILLSNSSFTNRLIAIGGFKYLVQFKRAAAVAANVYQPSSDTYDTAITGVARNFATSKVVLNPYTAFKQVLAIVSYLTEPSAAFQGRVLVNLAKGHQSFKWAYNNLPEFRKRWESSALGDEKLGRQFANIATEGDFLKFMDASQKFVQKYGMLPNKLVDSYICAVGAKSLYETNLKKYEEMNLTEEQARERALIDGSNLYNTTQQSSEGLYVSSIQMDRTFFSTAYTVFNNSSIAYNRQVFEAARNLKNAFSNRANLIENRTKFNVRTFNISEEDAKKAAVKEVDTQIMRDVLRLAVFGYGVQFIWRLGASFPYLLFGDDDDKKKKIAKEAATGGALITPIRGLLFGATFESVIDGLMEWLNTGSSYAFVNRLTGNIHPIISDVDQLARAAVNKNMNSAKAGYLLVNLGAKLGWGMDLKPFANATYGFVSLINSDELTANDVVIDIMSMLSVPQSQLKALALDNPETFFDRYIELKELVDYGLLAPVLELNPDDLDNYIKSGRRYIRRDMKEKSEKQP